MADKYLLEDGSGSYLLEDGSGSYLLEGTDPSCVVEPTGGFFWLFEDGSIMALEDCTGGWLLEDQSGTPEPEPTPDDTTTPPTYGGGDHDYEMRVRSWWGRIEQIRADRQAVEAKEAAKDIALRLAREAAERAEAAAKRRGKRKAERLKAEAELKSARDDVTALEAELGVIAGQIQEFDAAMAELTALIDAERVLKEQRLAFMAARRRMMLALVLASQ